MKALSPKYSILPVRPIVRPAVGCGAVHVWPGQCRGRLAKRESKYRFPSNTDGIAALILGPEAALIASRSVRCYWWVLEQAAAVTSPVSSMPWCLATEATPRQLRGRSCAEITRHAAGRDAHTAHTQSSLPAGQGHEKPPFLDGAGCNYMDMVSLLSQHSIPLCGGS